MATLTDFITNWGEVVELDFPKMDLNRVKDICDKHPGWKEYQSHKKPNNRHGLSVTSLDGQFDGPDLNSLRESGLRYTENHTQKVILKHEQMSVL